MSSAISKIKLIDDKWVTTDGRKHTKYSGNRIGYRDHDMSLDAIRHQKHLDNLDPNKNVCCECIGYGRISKMFEPKHDNSPLGDCWTCEYATCPTCEGNKYI